MWAAVLLLHACGGSEFESTATGGAGGSGGSGLTGGGAGASGSSASGGGGTSAGGGSGGTAGDGGTPGGGGAGGIAGSGGTSSGGGAGDSGADASVDAGPPPIVVVQASTIKLSMAPAATSNLTLPALPSAGNSIIVGVTCISDYGVSVDAGLAGDCILSNGSVTDNHGNTYDQVAQGASIKSSQQGARGYIFIAENIGAPSGSFAITVDPEGTSAVQAIAWGAIEVSGLKSPPSFDVHGYTAVNQATSTTASTFQPTAQANELAVAVLSIRHNQVYAAIVPDGTWSSHQIHQDSVTGPPAHSMVSKVLTSAGTPSHTWTHQAPSRGAAGVIATFKGAAQD